MIMQTSKISSEQGETWQQSSCEAGFPMGFDVLKGLV